MNEKQAEAGSCIRIGRCPVRDGLHEPYTPSWEKEGRFRLMTICEPGSELSTIGAPKMLPAIEIRLCKHCGLVYGEEVKSV